MVVSDHLFQLIKSLSKNEKGYFKKYTSLYTHEGKSNYVKLFNIIDAQKEYNEEKVIRQLKKENFIQHISVVKNYLYNLILKSLDTYHSNTKKELNDYLHHIEILYDKALYKQCEIMLNRAQKLAQKYESHWHLAQLSSWEAELMLAQSYKGITEEAVQKVYDDLFNNIELYKNVHQYYNTLDNIYLHIYQSGLSMRNEQEIEKLKNYTGLFLNKTEDAALSYHARLLFFTCHVIHSYKNNDYPTSLKYAKKRVQLLEENPHQMAEKPTAYVKALQSQITCERSLNKYDDALNTIKKLKEIKVKSERLWNISFYLANMEELMIYLATGEFKKGTALIENTIDQNKRKNILLVPNHNQSIFHYTCAYIYLGAENYSMCIRSLDKLLNSDLITIRNDLYCFAKIMNLIAHYELGNSDLLEYTVKSTYQFLYKRNKFTG